LGEATTFPHIVFSAALGGGYIEMALFPGGLPRRSPETVLGWSPETLGAHISQLQPPIRVRSKPKL